MAKAKGHLRSTAQMTFRFHHIVSSDETVRQRLGSQPTDIANHGESGKLLQRGLGAEPQPKSNLVHFRLKNLTPGGNNFNDLTGN